MLGETAATKPDGITDPAGTLEIHPREPVGQSHLFTPDILV